MKSREKKAAPPRCLGRRTTRWDEARGDARAMCGRTVTVPRALCHPPGRGVCGPTTVREMCRNITPLRGLEPAATPEEIEAAALQFVRKVGGIQSVSARTEEAVMRAVAEITEVTTRLLDELPPRKVPPKTVPPMRRRALGAR